MDLALGGPAYTREHMHKGVGAKCVCGRICGDCVGRTDPTHTHMQGASERRSRGTRTPNMRRRAGLVRKAGMQESRRSRAWVERFSQFNCSSTKPQERGLGVSAVWRDVRESSVLAELTIPRIKS